MITTIKTFVKLFLFFLFLAPTLTLAGAFDSLDLGSYNSAADASISITNNPETARKSVVVDSKPIKINASALSGLTTVSNDIQDYNKNIDLWGRRLYLLNNYDSVNISTKPTKSTLQTEISTLKGRTGSAISRIASAYNTQGPSSSTGDSAAGTAATSAPTAAETSELQAQYDSCVAEKGVTNETCIALKNQLDQAGASQAASSTATTPDQPVDSSECSATSPGTWFTSCLYEGLTWIFSAIVITIGGTFVYIAGIIFDYSLWFSVFKFSDILKTFSDLNAGDSSSSIYKTWITVRNLFNIIIVFQLLRIALQKIVGSVVSAGKTRDLKKQLISIIIFTLFVNFSFFFTKALIDVSNITTLQFYSGLGASDAAESTETGVFTDSSRSGIGIAIVEGLGIHGNIFFSKTENNLDSSALLGVGVDSGTKIKEDDFTNSFTGNIILFGLLLLASFVLLQGASIFIGRAVYLIVIVVLSPLMFAKGIIGFVDDWSRKWWEMFMEQLFVAPLYMAMLYLTLKIAGNGESGGLTSVLVGQKESITSVAGFFGGVAVMLIQGAIMAGLFISAVTLAKKFAATSASRSMAYGGKVFGAGVGAVGRRTVGRGANAIKNQTWLQDRKAAGGIRGKLASGALILADKGSNSTFDYRNSSALKKVDNISGKFGLDSGLKNLGAGGTKTFLSARKDADQKKEDKEKADQKLLQEDTYGMSDEAKKAAEARNRDRLERNSLNRSLQYRGNETGGDMIGQVSDIQKIETELLSIESQIQRANLLKDKEKAEELKAVYDAKKTELDNAVKYDAKAISDFMADDVGKNTDLAKKLQDTSGLEGDALRAAVRLNNQTINDFKKAQTATSKLVNNTLRRASIIRSDITGNKSGVELRESAWKKQKKANVSARSKIAIDAILDEHGWVDKNSKIVTLPKDDILAELNSKIAATTNIRELTHLKGAKARLDGWIKEKNPDAVDNKKPSAKDSTDTSGAK